MMQRTVVCALVVLATAFAFGVDATSVDVFHPQQRNVQKPLSQAEHATFYKRIHEEGLSKDELDIRAMEYVKAIADTIPDEVIANHTHVHISEHMGHWGRINHPQVTGEDRMLAFQNYSVALAHNYALHHYGGVTSDFTAFVQLKTTAETGLGWWGMALLGLVQGLLDTFFGESTFFNIKLCAEDMWDAWGKGTAMKKFNRAWDNLVAAFKGGLAPRELTHEEIFATFSRPANGVYRFQNTQGTPLYFKHVLKKEKRTSMDDACWMWAPPGQDVWQKTNELTVKSGRWKGQKPTKANQDFLAYLQETCPPEPVLDTTDVGHLLGKPTRVCLKRHGRFCEQWETRFTYEAYAGEGTVFDKTLELRYKVSKGQWYVENPQESGVFKGVKWMKVAENGEGLPKKYLLTDHKVVVDFLARHKPTLDDMKGWLLRHLGVPHKGVYTYSGDFFTQDVHFRRNEKTNSWEVATGSDDFFPVAEQHRTRHMNKVARSIANHLFLKNPPPPSGVEVMRFKKLDSPWNPLTWLKYARRIKNAFVDIAVRSTGIFAEAANNFQKCYSTVDEVCMGKGKSPLATGPKSVGTPGQDATTDDTGLEASDKILSQEAAAMLRLPESMRPRNWRELVGAPLSEEKLTPTDMSGDYSSNGEPVETFTGGCPPFLKTSCKIATPDMAEDSKRARDTEANLNKLIRDGTDAGDNEVTDGGETEGTSGNSDAPYVEDGSVDLDEGGDEMPPLVDGSGSDSTPARTTDSTATTTTTTHNPNVVVMSVCPPFMSKDECVEAPAADVDLTEARKLEREFNSLIKSSVKAPTSLELLQLDSGANGNADSGMTGYELLEMLEVKEEEEAEEVFNEFSFLQIPPEWDEHLFPKESDPMPLTTLQLAIQKDEASSGPLPLDTQSVDMTVPSRAGSNVTAVKKKKSLCDWQKQELLEGAIFISFTQAIAAGMGVKAMYDKFPWFRSAVKFVGKPVAATGKFVGSSAKYVWNVAKWTPQFGASLLRKIMNTPLPGPVRTWLKAAVRNSMGLLKVGFKAFVAIGSKFFNLRILLKALLRLAVMLGRLGAKAALLVAPFFAGWVIYLAMIPLNVWFEWAEISRCISNLMAIWDKPELNSDDWWQVARNMGRILTRALI